MFTFLGQRKIIFLIIIAVVAGGIFLYFQQDKQPAFELVAVERGDIKEIISVTGQVKPAENINLAFERSGKVAKIEVATGDKIQAEQILATLENNDAKAQLAQAQASLASARALLGQYEAAMQTQQAKLDELKTGARLEEIQIAELAVDNAKKTLADTEANLANVEAKADADLRSDYDSAILAAVNAVNSALDSLFILTDIQFAHFLGYDQNSSKLAAAKGNAILLLLGTSGADRYTKEQINVLTGGTKLTVQTTQNNPTFDNIDKTLIDSYQALLAVKNALDAVPVSTSLTSAEQTNLSSEKASINTQLSTISSNQQTIAVQKSANQSSITTAESNVTTAKNSLANAEANLALKKAGATAEQIAAQEAQVRQADAAISVQRAAIQQAQANVLQAQDNLNKTILRAPAGGIVTSVEKKRGEVVQPNAPIVSVINSGNFQIEANISETEIINVKIGDRIDITLDAFGPREKFSGQIIKIDPAETMVTGVIYYKVTCIFDTEDERIKSGMTTNLEIKTAQRDNVLQLPYFVILERNGGKYVKIYDGNKLSEREIKTGLEGETMVEIIEGIEEGQQIAIER